MPAVTKKQRIVFSFDNRSLDALKKMAEKEDGNNMARAVRKSIELRRALNRQREDGFEEIIVRNPKTKQERVLVLAESA